MDAEQTTPPTAPSLGRVTIKNFKSIKEVSFDTRRINLFVGRPNTGKSNILEALGLLGVQRGLSDVVRFEKLGQLYHHFNEKKNIQVNTTKSSISIRRLIDHYDFWRIDAQHIPKETVQQFFNKKIRKSARLSENGDFHEELTVFASASEIGFDLSDITVFRRYEATSAEKLITSVLLKDDDLLQSASNLISSNDYQFGFDVDRVVLYSLKNGRVFFMPLLMMADTLKRLLFYQCLISSYRGWVLVLEEPEVHSYPPYVSLLASRIAEATSNQFFIATHSPYLVNTLLDKVPDSELRIFIVDYVGHETKIHVLTDDDLQDIRINALDIFYNLDNLLEDAAWKK